MTNNSFWPITPFEDESYSSILTGIDAVTCINSYFCNISNTMSEKFVGTEAYSFEGESCHKVHRMNPIRIRPVMDRIREIDIFKSSGLEDLSSRLLKLSLLAIPEYFTS